MPIANLSDKMQISYVFEEREKRKEPVVFINGSIFNFKQWLGTYIPAFDATTEKSFSYLLYDYQGIGESSPRTEQFSLQGLADELLGLLDHLGLEKVHLFGVSKGTMVGQVFTGLYPNRVLSLAGYGIVNLLAVKATQTTRNMFHDLYNEILTLNDILDDEISPSNSKRFFRTILTPALFLKSYSRLRFNQKMLNWYLERRVRPLLIGTPIRTLEMLFRYYTKEIEDEIGFYEECVEKIGNKPVLLLNGTTDMVTPIELARDLEPRLKNANLVEYEGFEHISPNSKKKQAKKIMIEYSEFLSSLYS